ncbi:Bacteriophage Rz lysis protein [Pseudomonas lundensis]|uniref:lysis system i-spanin subunit Rz n=1 Tax=Pseudomonas lundensis TaxID=86185 RepID=UPI0008868854|nr:lysis system i-spanin subunit Rz [Pseudomonas lundensis]SDQ79906.1 Bacteriophage Rz lysis protein [Pseudomonas lundensis]
MTPAALKTALAGVLALLLLTAGGVWKVQDWRYGKQLAEQSGLHQDDLTAISNAAADQVRNEQGKRLALEGRLQVIDETHFKEFSDAQKNISRLRDRLATADLRLSVLLDAADSASGCNVPSTPGAVGVVHGAARARLDPAHAQRIIGITDSGDQGLIALRACQAYVRAVLR